MTEKFIAAATQVVEANQQFFSGKISPVEHRRLREAGLASALTEAAAECGVSLVQPLQVDSRGEFNITAVAPVGYIGHGESLFGQDFANLLNGFSPRCGLAPGAVLEASNGWCMMNHFNVEKMILARLAQVARSMDAEQVTDRPRAVHG